MGNTFNLTKLKKIFEKEGYRISNTTLKKFSQQMTQQIQQAAKKTIRNAKISGRKTIKPQDIKTP